MFLARLLVTREGYHGNGTYYGLGKKIEDQPLVATVEIIGAHGKTEIRLSEEASDKVIAIMAEELAAQARAVADAMTADFIIAGTSTALIAAAEQPEPPVLDA
jgi:hypothetical protein